MSFPREYSLFSYKGKLYVRALPSMKALAPLQSPSRTFLLRNLDLSLANQLLASLISTRSQHQELQHIVFAFKKPQNVTGTLDISLKTGPRVTTKATLFPNCSVHINRS